MALDVIIKGPLIVFGFSKTCERDCESIKTNFTDGLVTQFLLEWSCNVDIEHCDLFQQFKTDVPTEDEYFEWSLGTDGEWLTHAAPLKPRPRSSYANRVRYDFLHGVTCNQYCLNTNMDSTVCSTEEAAQLDRLVSEFTSSGNVDHQAVHLACMFLALVAHKDMN